MNAASIVIPTYNEVENIRSLIEKLVSQSENYRIIVVDDNSPDGTAQVVQELARNCRNIILHQRPGKLGIGSAIRDGLEKALAFPDCCYIVTMDADLSFDPQDIPRLLKAAEEGHSSLVQGSRYVKGGGIIGWNAFRKMQSRVANFIAKSLLGLPNEVTSCFRLYTREGARVVIEDSQALDYGFLVAATLAIKSRGLKIEEVPIIFTNRVNGKSKLKLSDALVWFGVIFRLFIYHQIRKGTHKALLKFCVVGTLGILLNMGILWILTEYIGIFYTISAILGIEASILFNFGLNNYWTFRTGNQREANIPLRILKYNLICLTGTTLNLGILTLMTEAFGIYYLISNLFGIAAAVLWNYVGSIKWVWQMKLPAKD